MHSALSRLNSVTSNSIAALSVIAALSFGQSVFTASETPDASFEATKYLVQKYKNWVDDHEVDIQTDVAFFNVNLDANLTRLFNWNVRQIFCLLAVEYENEASRNHIVAWDKIVLREDGSILKLRNARPKYHVRALEAGSLRGVNTNVSLTLSWNVIPLIGLLPLRSADYVYRVHTSKA